MIAEKITFGEHEQEEFALLPKQVIINPPEVKTYLVPVPGRSGSLSFTLCCATKSKSSVSLKLGSPHIVNFSSFMFPSIFLSDYFVFIS